MKKLLALILTVTCVLALGACGNSGTSTGDTSGADSAPAYESATEVLTTVWDAYGDDEKFMAWGGNAESMTDGAPGTFDVSNTDELIGSLIVPADLAASIDDAANLMHGMNLNMFTAAAFHVEDTAAFAEGYAENLKVTQWMCGAPETYVIFDAGNGYVVTVFGATDLVDIFKTHATETLTGATVISEGPVVE